jgi:GGDEF domain-containing protein
VWHASAAHSRSVAASFVGVPFLATARFTTIRRLLLGAGVAVLAAIVVGLIARGVDSIEVIAAALYVGVYVGGLAAGVVGGAAGGLLAGAIYALARYDAIDALGFSRYAGLMAARIIGYVLFGVFVGAAWQFISERLDKLDAFDDVDDETLLLNPRGLVDVLDRETSRAKRFGSTFSVVTIDVPLDVFDAQGRRRRRASLREFGRLVTQASRDLDQAGLFSANKARRLAVVLPETDKQGAQVVVGRLVERVGSGLLTKEVSIPRTLRPMGLAYPDDAVQLAQLRADLIELDVSRGA